MRSSANRLPSRRCERVCTVTRGISVVSAGVLAALTLLTSCGAGPSQVGAAAIVGNTVVPLDTVQHQLDAVLNKEPAAQQAQQQRRLDTAARQIVTLRVQHELIRQVAAAEHLVADQKRVDALLAQGGGAEQASRGTVFDAMGIRERSVDEVLLADLARKQMPGLAVTFDYVLVADRHQAEQVARRLAADPGSAPAIIGSVGSTGSAAIGQRITAAQDPQDAEATPLFGLEPNTVAAFPAGQQSTQWLVVLVTHREKRAVSVADESQLDTQTLASIGLHLLAPYAQRAKIRINPRYGYWDPISMQVAPSADETLGLQLTAGATAQ